MPETHLPFLEAYPLLVLGVVISIALPILRRYLPETNVPGVGPINRESAPPGAAGFWQVAKPYVLIGIFAAVTALLVLVFIDTPQGWKSAIAAGYAWDSTLQKFKG